jgi:hypothetical protein
MSATGRTLPRSLQSAERRSCQSASPDVGEPARESPCSVRDRCLRLGRAFAEPEVHGLLSMMLLLDARRAACFGTPLVHLGLRRHENFLRGCLFRRVAFV